MNRTAVMRTIGLSLSVFSFSLYAALSSDQTQSQLAHLNDKIGTLKQKLNGEQQQQTQAEHALSTVDIKLSRLVRQTHLIELEIARKQAEIQKGTRQAQQLSAQLKLHQIELMKQVRMVYMLGAHQPLKSLLMSDKTSTLERWLIFYQYIIHSRQQLMDNIFATQTALNETQHHLEQQITAQNQLSLQLHQERSTLAQAKTEQTQVVAQLTHTLKTDQQTLQEYERDKLNLSALLQRLALQQVARPVEIKASHEKQIPSPIQAGYTSMKPWNQGLVFFSREGTKVQAVRSGRVVFSDWLRGYGLLLILDHGHGWMSLYGYNQSLYRRVGEWVNAGDQIATVGHSGGRREDGLYFEVRRMGHVVAARQWLLARG